MVEEECRHVLNGVDSPCSLFTCNIYKILTSLIRSFHESSSCVPLTLTAPESEIYINLLLDLEVINQFQLEMLCLEAS